MENVIEDESLKVKASQDEVAEVKASAWQEKGKVLSNSHNRHQWEIADWLIEGIALYTDGTPHANASRAYDDAEKIFPEYTRSTFQTWVCVGRAFGSLTRDKYPSLRFGHFKAVVGVTDLAERDRWLAEAQEKGLSVSALRFAITAIAGGLVSTFTPTETNTPVAAAKRKEEKGYSLPLSYKQKNALETLALVRGISPATLAARAVDEYLEAHADEVASGVEQQQKKYDEMSAMWAAHDAVARASYEAAEAARKEAETAREEKLRQKCEELWQEHVEPLRQYATENDNTDLLNELKRFDAWREQKQCLSPNELEMLPKRVKELKEVAVRKERERKLREKLEDIWQEHVEPLRHNDYFFFILGEELAKLDAWRKQQCTSQKEMMDRVKALLERVEELKKADELRQVEEAQPVEKTQQTEEAEQ